MEDGTDPMPSGYYEIIAEKGSTFSFHVEYYDDAANPIDLTGNTVRFHVSPHYRSGTLYLSATTSGVTVGGTTGHFIDSTGIRGTGGISLNCGPEGTTFLGGILVTVDDTSMSYIRAGQWKYSIDVISPNEVEEILSGQFTVVPKVTQ